MSTQKQQTTSGAQTQTIPCDVIAELSSEGASRLFLDVVTTPTEEIEGVGRNSARSEVLKYMDWAADSNKDVTDYLNYGGGFFSSLFDGEPTCPDKNNQKILEHVRGR